MNSSTELSEMLYTDPKICYYYHLRFHRATTTSVEVTAPVLEIMLSNIGIVFRIEANNILRMT
jgi:hypothetical protein